MRLFLSSLVAAFLAVFMPAELAGAPVIAAGGNVSLLARDGGFLWAAGAGGYRETQYKPVAELAAGRTWVSLSSRDKGSVGIDSGGELWTWGSGTLGVPGVYGTFYPVRVGTDTDWRAVTASGGYSYAIKTDGALWAWGYYSVGNVSVFSNPAPAQFGTALWKSVTGGYYNVGIQVDGSLWAWGHNAHGSIGDGTTISRTAPVKIGSANWASAATVDYTSFGIKVDGSLYAWGDNYGAYGNGGTASSQIPLRIGTDKNWRKVCGFYQSIVGLRTDGSLWTWGAPNSVPVRIGTDTTWTDIASGESHFLATRADGSVWGWGNNSSGQLGITGVASSSVPIDISSAFGMIPRFAVYGSGDPEPDTRDIGYPTVRTAILQEPTAIDIRVRNTGFAPLELTGATVAGYTVTVPAPVPALADSFVHIHLDAASAGNFSGDVVLNSNDADHPSYTLHLDGTVVSPANDTDGDGLNDAAEVALSSFGFLWNSRQPVLMKMFFDNVGLTGLHHEGEILEARWNAGAPVLDAGGQTLSIPLEIRGPGGLLPPANLRETSGNTLDAELALPAGKRFLRF